MVTRWLIDENIPRQVRWWMIGQGYTVISASEAGLSGKSDEALYAFAEEHQMALLTLDLDFSDPIRFPLTFPRLVLRPGVLDPEWMRELLARYFAHHRPRYGELCVVQPGGMACYEATLG
jgi:predicted nuclease of predicted toxin-antitoxin system